MIKKYGIDISAHQGNIDFTKLKDQVDFVIIRACYGTNKDSMFETYYNACKKNNIKVGAYIYGYSLDSKVALEEANYMLNLLNDKTFEYPIYYDMEDADFYKVKNGMPSNEVLTDICNTFCEILENAGYYVGVYASQSWFDNKLNITKYDKWVANWGTDDGKEQKDTSKMGGMLQYTSKKTINGMILDGDVAYLDYPSIIKSKGLNGYGNSSNPVVPVKKTIVVGSKVQIGTMAKYKYWVPDAIKVMNGIYQIRENVNAGGASAFDWIDNGIPEACVDICDKNGVKTADSDSRHIKMGDKFVFAKTFTVTKIAKDGKTYYQLDYDGNVNHRFWVIGDYLKLV